MIFKYDVKEINGLKYITGSRLIEEFGYPSEEYEFAMPFGQEQIDENGKYQWTIRDNPDYNAETDPIDGRYLIERNPISKTNDEIIEERRIKVNAEIQTKLPELMRIIALDDTKGFEELKIEIRAIDQSIKAVQQK